MLSIPSGFAAPLAATALGLCGAALGLGLTGARRVSRVLVPFSAGLLLGVVAFSLVPELGREVGWPAALAVTAGGYLVLLAVNKWVYPVCPTCSHTHDHDSCSMELHGFAGPLIAAAALHSFLDGWSIAAAQMNGPAAMRMATPVAVALHKLPEGMALGTILRAAVRSRASAAGWSVVALGPTLLGGVAGLEFGPGLGTTWTNWPLGLAAGWLCYLGYHAVDEEARRRGAQAALLSAAGGAAIAAAVQAGAEIAFR